jgi:hypothetical protein
MEGEDLVGVPDLLAHRVEQRRSRVVEPHGREAVGDHPTQPQRGAHGVVVLAVRRLLLSVPQRLVEQEILVGVLLGEPAPACLH